MHKLRTKRWVYLALTVTLLLAVMLTTPQGRAFAQRLFLFFRTTNEKSLPIPTEQMFSIPATRTPVPTSMLTLQPVEPSVPPTLAPASPDFACASPEAGSEYDCQIKAVEVQAGFEAQEFPYDPKGMKFSQATFNPKTKEIDMEFLVISGGGALYLSQGLGEFPASSKWGEVPADEIKQVSVNGQYAELVSGGFYVYPNATAAVWEPGGQISLHWQAGNRWFSLEKMGDPQPIEWIDESEMIKLAESLVDERLSNETPPIDPEYLTSVEAAEGLAGFDVPAPTILPEGYELKRVVWADEVVRLLYGPKNSTETTLFIFIGRITDHKMEPCSECPPGTVEDVQIGPWPGWYSRGIFSTGPGVAGQPTPTPVWDANAREWHLEWNADRLWFNLWFSSDSGEEMNKETMVKIAESMK
ncbi:MAG TPA: hypothetical protein VK249_06095 [Anaerolineales bacterium]|nr:hypothetical protein [Anaerolineales bacterium]